jgi:molybdate transport system substrate-binding protein
MTPRSLALAIVSLAALMSATAPPAAAIEVFASNGVKAALDELAPAYEKKAGVKINIHYGLAAVLKKEIEGGAAFDVAILTAPGIDDLAKQGKVDGMQRADVARSGVGIGIRAGAPRPDIHDTAALKRTLLAAKSVAWAKEGASGVYFVSVLERIGIAEPVKAKAILAKDGADVGARLVKGEAELGALLVNELMAVPGVEVVGPLPPDLQHYTVFAAAVAPASKEAAAAGGLVAFLHSAPARATFKAKGQDPD